MRIYLDVDDVLCETARALCGLAAREFGRSVEYADVREFDLGKVFSFAPAEMEKFSRLSHSPELLLSLEPAPGAVEGVKALLAAGAEVDVLTGRPAGSHEATEEWLRRAGLGGLGVEYVDKYGRAGARRAGEPPTLPLAGLMAREYDAAVDDSPVILRHLAAWGRTRVVVYSRPWNESFALAANMARAEGWPAAAVAALGRPV